MQCHLLHQKRRFYLGRLGVIGKNIGEPVRHQSIDINLQQHPLIVYLWGCPCLSWCCGWHCKWVKWVGYTLRIILVVLDGSHISILLHLPGSLILSTTTYHHPQVKAPLMLQWMALHMWAMSGKQLVKYKNILTLILLALDPTQISPYKTWPSE